MVKDEIDELLALKEGRGDLVALSGNNLDTKSSSAGFVAFFK
jgi:hypothetical protein